jgi:DNA-binding SARP family transcriptional activator
MDMVRRPHLLALAAATDWEAGRVVSAVSNARVARELAEQEGDSAVVANSLMILAQAALTQCDFLLARTYLDKAIELCAAGVDDATRAGLFGRRLLINAAVHDLPAFASAEKAATDLKESGRSQAEESSSLLRFYLAMANILLRGDYAASAAPLKSVSQSRSLTRGTRSAAAYDYYACMVETGRLSEAQRALCEYARLIAGLGNDGWEFSLPSLEGILSLTLGATDGVGSSLLSATSSAWDSGERLSVITELSAGALGSVGCRLPDEALVLSERATTLGESLLPGPLHWMAHLARASAMLLMDDRGAALRAVPEIHSELHGSPVRYHHLQADLILAEIDCRNGDSASATERLREHVPYILTESANWVCAMYIRAFPRLLGPLAAAVGADHIPVHMLKLILPVYAEEAVAAARNVLPADAHEVLAQRLLGKAAPGRRSTDTKRNDALHVRLFGGLEVHRPCGGPVGDREWRKRKARLMFAMLVTRHDRDVPREQLIEYLWPEMDEQTALNNFYVVWSAMKRAIAPGLKRGDACPYVDHRSGVCKVVSGWVTTDLGEFEEQLGIAAKARSNDDADVELNALRRAIELYQGEILPGEAYDDWFASVRERCRHEFEAACLRASGLLESRGQVPEALMLVRRALEHDPWREDLYQAALRLQMTAGQRSAAIETYFACRSRLIDDLGIDPSADTRKLYEQILCMEDGPESTNSSAANRQDSVGNR